MHDTGCSELVHWDDPEGWDGREVGGGFRMGNTCTLMVDSSQCMAKPIKKKKRKDVFFLVLVLEGPVGLHRTIQLQLLWH